MSHGPQDFSLQVSSLACRAEDQAFKQQADRFRWEYCYVSWCEINEPALSTTGRRRVVEVQRKRWAEWLAQRRNSSRVDDNA